MNKLLLHICCGPCASYPVPFLQDQGYEVCGYFYNPNIHPFTEYQKRRQALSEYASSIDLPVIYEEEHDPAEYMRQVVHREDRRCIYCYRMRLEKTAQMAQKGGFSGFATTLGVSPYQKQELIQATGEAMAEHYGIPFLYYDFRPGYRETVKISRQLNLYRQKYCGCFYSELERYAAK